MFGGRSANRIKELEEYIDKPSSQQEKIYYLNELAWELRMDYPEKVYALCARAEQLSRSGQYSLKPFAPGIAGSLISQAFVDTYKGHLDTAVSKCFQALTLLENPHSHLGVRAWFTLGWNNFFLSDYPAALENGLKALELARGLGDRLHEAWALDAVASFHGVTGDFEAAVPLHEEALAIFGELHEELGKMRTLNNLAVSLYEIKDFDLALETGLLSLKLAQQQELEMDVHNNSCTISDILVGLGRLDDAEGYLKESILGYSHLDITRVFVLTRVGNLRLLKNDLAGAESYITQALELSASLKQYAELANCHKLLSEIKEKQGQYFEALEHYRIHHELQNKVQGEQSVTRLNVLKIRHQVETAQHRAEIYRLKASELEKQVDEQKVIQSILEFQSTIDPLTELYNRRYFDDALEREYSRHSRSGARLSLLIMDVDYFKKYNDTYGHLRGDDCLRQIAKVIMNSISRPPDLAARFGGEEFVCILPETDLIGAENVAEKIRIGVLELAISHAYSMHKFVTLSIGVFTTLCDKDGTANDLIAKADEQLYAAKALGRNRVAARS